MRTLVLRRGACVAVDAAEWRDAFGIVTRGRVQLELRDGERGPVLARDAGFWLRGTGVRALRNPGGRTARVRIVSHRHVPVNKPVTESGSNDMKSMSAKRTVPSPASGQTSPVHRLRGLAAAGVIATLAAMVATTLAAALAGAVGVDFVISDGGETIPLSGFAVVTGFFSVVGVGIAAALLRWSARPAERFVQTAVALTAISFVPPLLTEAAPGTTIALIGLHLVAATVMIPTLAWSLRSQSVSKAVYST